MPTIFCCSDVRASHTLGNDEKLNTFLNWAAYPTERAVHPTVEQDDKLADSDYPYYIRLAKMVNTINFGPVETKRYFAPMGEKDGAKVFVELAESDLKSIAANYTKRKP